MVASKAKGILDIDSERNLVTQGCLSAKVSLEAFRSLPFFTLVTELTMKQQNFEKYKILVRLNDGISKIASAESPQKSSQDEQSLQSVVGTISSEQKLQLSSLQSEE